VQWELPFRVSPYVDEMQDFVVPTPPGKPNGGTWRCRLDWPARDAVIDGGAGSFRGIAVHGKQIAEGNNISDG
jgi:hypothetical protein